MTAIRSSETTSIESENAFSEPWCAIKSEVSSQAEDRNPQSFDAEEILTVKDDSEGISTSESAGAVKPYSCKYCDYNCEKSSHLRLHVMSAHTRKRPFACPGCSYSCTQSSNLRRHVRAVHAPPKSAEDSKSKKRLTCSFCDYKCAQSGNLKSHIAYRHTGEKPYICGHCGYRSSQSSNLKRHVNLRHAYKPSLVLKSTNLTRIEQAKDLQAASENTSHKFDREVQRIGRPHFSADNYNPTHLQSGQPQVADEKLKYPSRDQLSNKLKEHLKLKHSVYPFLESTGYIKMEQTDNEKIEQNKTTTNKIEQTTF